ncbi:MAG: hypothetical protein V2A54_01075 [Bacteroidota bacterium]
MKTKLTILLSLIFSLAVADGGGGKYSHGCRVHALDNTTNVFFTSIDGKIKYLNEKNKEEFAYTTTNISVFNISENTTANLFPENFNEGIIEFYFESSYNDFKKKISFNGNDNDYNDNYIVGNYDIPKRAVCDKVFVITYNFETKQYSFWVAHKTGKDLQRVYQCTAESNYYFDVKNQVIRFEKQNGSKIEIKDIKY